MASEELALNEWPITGVPAPPNRRAARRAVRSVPESVRAADWLARSRRCLTPARV
jgi:hypothetical protein